ncbi:hypothetical protein ACVWXN_002698 [Bradyrhizobium sp. i1.4.4]
MKGITRTKLAKIIPRMASDHDGEVLASVTAIRTRLAADGLDLHDLAAVVAAGADSDPIGSVRRKPDHSAARRNSEAPPRPATATTEENLVRNREGAEARRRSITLRIEEIELNHSKLTKNERSIVGKVKWRLSRGRAVEHDLIVAIERISTSIDLRRREYKTGSKAGLSKSRRAAKSV